MTKTNQITDFRVSWTADREQYYQGHGIADQDFYTHSGQGCGETLREAFYEALDNLREQDIEWTVDDYKSAVADLTAQLREPEMIDWTIVEAECDANGEHTIECQHDDTDGELPCATCDGKGSVEDPEPDCAVCAGEWHFYVNVDVKVEAIGG